MKKVFIFILLMTFPFYLFPNEEINDDYEESFDGITQSEQNFKDNNGLSAEKVHLASAGDFIGCGVIWSGSLIPTIAVTTIFSLYVPMGNFISTYYDFSSLLNLPIQMGIAGGMLLYLGLVKRNLSKNFDELTYKYEMSKVMRNVGIIVLSTSVIPLAAAISHFFYFHGVSIVNFGINVFFSLNQIVLGIMFLCFGQSRLNYWLDVISSFNVSMIHDDKKDLTEGYSVQIGARIRL